MRAYLAGDPFSECVHLSTRRTEDNKQDKFNGSETIDLHWSESYADQILLLKGGDHTSYRGNIANRRTIEY